jgi:Zn-dependent protease with chaperone function
MALNQEQFEALVKRLEIFAREQPKNYRLRVGLLAALGYAYLFLVLGSLLSIAIGLGWLVFYSHKFNALELQGGFLLLIPVFAILKSLWVRLPLPLGRVLDPKEAPHLFAVIKDLSSSLDAPFPDQVLITTEFNASVVQLPRLGIFGWQKNYLLLGLPLMEALTPEQFRGVLAHELAHLSGNHGRFASWIYRVRKTWVQILSQVQANGNSFLFDSFFNWYAPFFDAYSFVFVRMNEYEADRCAAQVVGPKNIAEALINVEIRNHFLEYSFWPRVSRQLNEQAEPPSSMYTHMLNTLRLELAFHDAERWFHQALKQQTNTQDTHPCLTERLSALGLRSDWQPELPPSTVVIEVSSARHFLQSALEPLTDHFNESWKQEVSLSWQERHHYLQGSKKSLRRLEEKAQHQVLTEEEAWERAYWTVELQERQQAIPLLQEILFVNPNHVCANYLLGEILLEQENTAGIALLEKAIALDPEISLSGNELIYLFHRKQGRQAEANRYLNQIEQHQILLTKVSQERSSLSDRDHFKFHHLSDSEIVKLTQQLANYPEITEAYLVQKEVEYLPDKPLYILALRHGSAWWQIESSYRAQKLCDQVASEMTFPGGTYILVLDDLNKKVEKKIFQIPGASIYLRKSNGYPSEGLRVETNQAS